MQRLQADGLLRLWSVNPRFRCALTLLPIEQVLNPILQTGDSCKFLHAREDYKQGWQLDKEWENVTKGRKNVRGTVDASAEKGKAQEDEEEEEDVTLKDIPFVCIICKESYKAPIVTRCGHYFCEPCALERYRRDPSCAACGSGTNGIFNSADQLKKLLKKKRERGAVI